MNSIELSNLYFIILNKVKDAIVATNSSGHIVFYNKSAEVMLGFSPNNSKKDWVDQFALLKQDKKTIIDKWNHPISRAIRDERIQNEEFVLAPKNKIPRPILITTHTIISNGIKEGAIIVIQDITHQKEAEKKLTIRSKSLMEAYEGLRRAEAGLKITNSELEKRVAERTQHLTRINKELQVEIHTRLKTEQKIKQSNAELIKTNQDLDNFIYTASHDLRAPISNIEGLINALKDESAYTEDGSKRLIDLICESVEKFKSTISDLTEISKVQKGDDGLIEVLSFQEILIDTKFTIQDLIKTTHANIVEDFSKCPQLKFSRKNLRSIFYNLISNAIKYSQSSKLPEIKLKTEVKAGYCVLKVSDNGMGIPEGKMHQIFSMFKRLHDHVEGSGIGLYIVKRIIDNADGKIEVNSVLGKGTEFTIFLPYDNSQPG